MKKKTYKKLTKRKKTSMLGQEDIIITIVDNGSAIVIVHVKDSIKEA